MTGTLYGVGVGPGDPDLMSLKAARIIAGAPVVAYFAKRGQPGNAYRTATGHLSARAEQLRFDYPYTTDLPVGDARYEPALESFYDMAGVRIAERLQAGADVAVLCEGDPFFYGSYMYLHDRLSTAHRCEVVPGITGMSGCWTRAGMPMVRGDDVLSVFTATLSENDLVSGLQVCDAAVIMKVGRNLPKVRAALTRAGCIDRALYVERGTMPDERIERLCERSDAPSPYFALVLVPGEGGRR